MSNPTTTKTLPAEQNSGYQPKTGQPCHCKPGIQRDNCPDCEGTGQQIDFAAIRTRRGKGQLIKCPCCGEMVTSIYKHNTSKCTKP